MNHGLFARLKDCQPAVIGINRQLLLGICLTNLKPREVTRDRARAAEIGSGPAGFEARAL